MIREANGAKCTFNAGAPHSLYLCCGVSDGECGKRYPVYEVFDCLQIMLFEHMPTSAQLNLFCLAAPAYKANCNTGTVDLWPAFYLIVMHLDSS